MSARSSTVAIVWAAVAAVSYGAPPDCAECHADIVARQSRSRHARTLTRYGGSRLAELLMSTPAEDGGFRFEYSKTGVTVRRRTERASAPLEWAFGAGAHGLTAVGRHDGLYFEHRLSYYAAPRAPALTPGHVAAPPRRAVDALGVFKLPEDIYRCFDCHATGLARDIDGGPDFSRMTPGITCSRCHGPGEEHARAVRAGRPTSAGAKLIFDAARLPAKASVEFCGGCHRLPQPGQESATPEIKDPVSVRFQPFGLMVSRCFRESRALSCLTCHDPHEDASREANAYTRRCLGCHAPESAATANCKRRESADCVPCHMRKTSPLAHMIFTDHRIRVY